MVKMIALITIPVAIPMAESLLKRVGYAGDILEMTLDDYNELSEKFASKQEGVTDGN